MTIVCWIAAFSLFGRTFHRNGISCVLELVQRPTVAPFNEGPVAVPADRQPDVAAERGVDVEPAPTLHHALVLGIHPLADEVIGEGLAHLARQGSIGELRL